MSDEKNYERPEIQAAMLQAVEAKLTEMEIPLDTLNIEHARRLMRSLGRIAVAVGLKFGCSPHEWMHLCVEMFAKESGIDKASTPEEATAILAAKTQAKGQAN